VGGSVKKEDSNSQGEGLKKVDPHPSEKTEVIRRREKKEKRENNHEKLCPAEV